MRTNGFSIRRNRIDKQYPVAGIVDLPEILGMSDRVLVIKGGQKKGELSRSELSQEKILQMAL